MPSLIIGIDLGTTTTVVSRINEAGKPELIMNWDNQPFTHSSIWFTKDSPLQPVIGSTARENAGVEEGAFKEYKRDMGTERVYHAHGKQYTPTELSALMLRKQREHIENTCGQKVDMVVITTPANFLNEARAATIAAAKAAGFPDPITTIDEPTAAALFYADSESTPLDGHYLVYDFGGGTLDVTVLEAKAKDIKVKYSMGVAQLGGKDFDETLRNLISQKFKEKTGATMEVNDTGFSDFDAEKVKYKLSEVEKHDFKVNSMNHGKVAVSVTRAEFEEQISALITQAEFCLEGALEKACAEAGVEYVINPGEGAFYGPKLEFVLRDAIGRDWQCGTLQVDFVLPERLDAEYVGEDGARHRPVMLHRAILGSFERFLGILIEQFAGRFPLWLSPVQVAVATIVSDADGYAAEVAALLRAKGLEVKLDTSNQKINAKIREHSVQHVPVIAVVGRKEAEQRTVALRRLGGEAQEVLPLDEAVARLAAEAMAPDLVRGAA